METSLGLPRKSSATFLIHLQKLSKNNKKIVRGVFVWPMEKLLQHVGARPPPLCAQHSWVVFFQNGAQKVGKGFSVPPYWIYV